MDWTAIRLLYLSELRSALRERSVLINGILIPLLMYPLMMWVMFTGALFVTARFESLASRVEIAGLPAEHRGVLDRLEEDGRTRVTEVDSPPAAAAAAYREDVQNRLLAGELDAALIFEPATDTAGAAAGMSEAERLCDRIAIIDQGRIRACDDLEGLRAATSRHYLEDIFVHYVTGDVTANAASRT